MLTISNNNIIRVTRGDSFTLSFTVHDLVNEVNVNDDVLLHSGESLYFRLMEPNMPFEHALIRKKITAVDNMTEVSIEFKPEDTEFLLPGLYYYSVKIGRDFVDDDQLDKTPQRPTHVSTLIKKTKFYIID